MSGKVLVIGFGSIGERHARCFLKTGRCAVSVCEISPELRRRAETEYDIERTYADLDAAMSDHHDCAVIATPAPFHIPMATRLAEAGVHLLIEKPLSVSLEGLEELKTVVVKQRVVAMIGYTLRCNPALVSMRAELQAGRFGRPLQIIGTVGQRFAKYRPAFAETYFAKRESGGGAIQDAITHLINAGEWLVGPITRLMADAAHLALPGVSVEDTVHVLARHGKHGEVLGLYGLNLHQAPDEFTITVVADAGTCRLDLQRNRWSCKTDPDTPWEHHPFEVDDRDHLYICQAKTFLDAVIGVGPVTCTLAQAEQSLRVNLAMLSCADSPPWLELPPPAVEPSRPVVLAEKPRQAQQPSKQ
jgi:predicted dehydrogenase